LRKLGSGFGSRKNHSGSGGRHTRNCTRNVYGYTYGLNVRASVDGLDRPGLDAARWVWTLASERAPYPVLTAPTRAGKSTRAAPNRPFAAHEVRSGRTGRTR
jgi:hypothetical protein